MSAPIVLISTYPPRLCGIATFCEEAREFIRKQNADREVLVISHNDGNGQGVYPLIDMSQRKWWKPVSKKLNELKPYAVHIQHEYSLYEYYDDRGKGDGNEGFLDLLDAISEWPLVVEPHTIHGRLRDFEADFVYNMCKAADVVLFKCDYQKWRLDWTFPAHGWKTPTNIMIVPHGARPDRRFGVHEVPKLREELGLGNGTLAKHVVGLIGWIQVNKRWDILLSMWEEIAEELQERTGQGWDLLAAGTMRDPNHRAEYEKYRGELQRLQKKGIAHYYEFIPRGEDYYKMMAICDFIVLPSTDETQSGTLARIIALNKPYITTAPMEGLTAQTIESGGGLLFTNKKMLKEAVIKLACDEQLRMELGDRLEHYLDDVVSWGVVTKQYAQAYKLARKAKQSGIPIEFPKEF
ncbi:MAG: glycosyltransferase [Planctomycetota bacterium]|jgi:glycosyltransferase involved in cell wall biosynthesis